MASQLVLYVPPIIILSPTLVSYRRKTSLQDSQLTPPKQECIRSAITSAKCSLTDPACQCGSAFPVIQASATACLVKSNACTPTELTTAATRGNDLCKASLAGGSSNATVTAVGTGGSVPAPTSNGTALSTSAKLTSTAAGGSGGAKPTSAGAGGASSSSSKAGAAPTLIAGLGSVMGLVGGMIAVL